jgi:thiosulfate dehydrogenase [quinone] large subunit
MNKSSTIEVPEPKLSILLFADTRFSFVWLIVRLYVGLQWFMAGFGKIQNPVWVGTKAGVALQEFLTGALVKSSGLHPDVQSWYAVFLKDFILPNSVFFSYLISLGELLVGVALILGIFTGVAAFFGAYLNMNYLLAGTVSINPVLFLLELLLILAWRTAGWWGLDRLTLPLLGTPWKPGKIFKHKR